MSSELKVAVIGGGNWGTTIAKICGHNVQKYDQFHKTVKMYVYEEIVNGKKLTEIINTNHENVKYLPGKPLPPNVVAVPDVVQTAEDADILIFVLPHQFVKNMLKPLIGNVKPTAIGITLIKGFDISEDGKSLELFSKVIHKALNIEVNVLMGANLAGEIASEKFCETTIGCRHAENGVTLKRLIETPYFKVVVVDDVECVEACGALKNIVACGAGFADGLKCGDNTKAAIIRLGIIEMIKFTQTFYPGSKASTMLESCGVADVITSSYGGRNRKVSEAFVLTKKTIAELEVEMLNGQRLQGPETAAVVYHMLKAKGLENSYPLFTAIHQICIGQLDPTKLIECISDHPIYIRHDVWALSSL